MNKIKWLLITLLSACALTAGAQGYPERPVRVIIGFPPGSGTDVMGRVVISKVSEYWGQNLVADNRGGAGGSIAGATAAKAAPDGYTLLLIQPSLTINPHIFAKIPYDAVRDFAPISLVIDVPQIVSVHPSVQAKSIKELIALAKADPGKLTNGSPGAGTHPHLTSERFQQAAEQVYVFQPVKG